MVVGIVLIYSVVFPALHLQMNTGQMSHLLATPFWYRLMLVTRAAFAEETLFRGYPIERLKELTGSNNDEHYQCR
jgi:membrane protease YdiL (CAAX protease family)